MSGAHFARIDRRNRCSFLIHQKAISIAMEKIGAKSVELAILFFWQKIASVIAESLSVGYFLFLQFLCSIRDSAVGYVWPTA